MRDICVGDYVVERWGHWSGVVLSEDYRRQHQYLDRELYYEVLITTPSGESRIVEAPASDCVFVPEGTI